MHAKVTVADDTSFVGSFNLSRSGELNAENVLEIRNAELADRLAGYIDQIRGRYGAVVLPSSPDRYRRRKPVPSGSSSTSTNSCRPVGCALPSTSVTTA